MENRSAGWELMGGLALGALGGFMLGLLVAPKYGVNRENVGESVQDMRERTNDILESVRGNTESLLQSTRQAIEEQMAWLNEAVEAGRRAAEYKRAELLEQEGN